MTKIGKLWTGAVAYVSLLVGAGLSVAGNLADTYRTRGADVDMLDKVMAAGWPILVLLAIEMFVSPRWSTDKLFQVWRWLGCLAVGGMAMVVSWTHLHDLMDSRGQLAAVTFLGPLAIDGMAIMATGLILSTRVRGLFGHALRDIADSLGATVDTLAGGKYASSVRPNMSGVAQCPDCGRTDDCPHLVHGQAGHRDLVTRDMDTPWTDDGHGHEIEDCPDVTADIVRTAGVATDIIRTELDSYRWTPPDGDVDNVTRPDGELDAWTAGYERALDALSAGVGDEAEAFLSNVRVDTGMLPQRTRTSIGSVPAEFVDMVKAWIVSGEMSKTDMITLSAAWFGVSTRTVRRWLTPVMGQG